MHVVDARGLSCPEPLMLVDQAFRDHPGEAIQVLVSEPYVKANVEKFAATKARKASAIEEGSCFRLTLEIK